MTIANEEQFQHWNVGDDADHWVNERHRYEAMLSPFTEMLIAASGLAPQHNVLDIGCGCGSTTLAAARVVEPGRALGVDLSAPMLAEARSDATRERLGNVQFEQGDAQVHPFVRASVDATISRFGTLFFADPVAAFTNIRGAVRAGGRLAFVAWQSRDENEWLRVPAEALSQHVALATPAQPGAPGMFAFADPARASQVLADAGWQEVDVAARSLQMLAGGARTLDDAVTFFRTGSLGRAALADADASTAARALEALRAALEPYCGADGVRLGAGVWLVTAQA